MPQTISLQRGSITIASNVSATTLFTNSASVTATRVIVNGLLITTSSSTGANGKFTGVGGSLVVTPDGLAGTYMVGIVGGTQNSYSFSQFPINNSGLGVNNVVNPTTGLVFSLPTMPVHGSSGTNSSFSINANSLTAVQLVNNGNAQSNTTSVLSAISFCPQNFWIGPSDAVKFSPKTSQSYTAAQGKSPAVYYTDSYTVYYSFTLISES